MESSFALKTTTEAEDITVSSMLADLGIEGVIEDKILPHSLTKSRCL